MQDASKRARSKIWYRCSTCGEEQIQIGRHVKVSGHTEYSAIRWDEPHNYRSARHLVVAVRGAARAQTCACGKLASGWALRAGLHEFGQMAWSKNPHDYVAMCDRFHKHQDWPADAWADVAHTASAVAGARGGQSLAARRKEDPELDQAIRRVMSQTGKRLTSDPAHQVKMQDGIRRRREEDPAFNERYIENKRRAGRISNERRKKS